MAWLSLVSFSCRELLQGAAGPDAFHFLSAVKGFPSFTLSHCLLSDLSQTSQTFRLSSLSIVTGYGGIPRRQEIQGASGNGSHHTAWGEKPQNLQLTQHSFLQTPLLTQGSLADVCAGGSSNNELGVSADLLETNAQIMVSTVDRSLGSQWVPQTPPPHATQL